MVHVTYFSRYLLQHQLIGPSSVTAYINALNKGCRCLECKLYPLCTSKQIFNVELLRETLTRKTVRYSDHKVITRPGVPVFPNL